MNAKSTIAGLESVTIDAEKYNNERSDSSGDNLTVIEKLKMLLDDGNHVLEQILQ